MDAWIAEPCTTDLFHLGESCRWDEVRQELYWVNVDSGEFFRADANGPLIKVIRRYDLGGYVTAIAPMEDRRDGWIVARDQSLFALSESGELTELASPEARHGDEVRTNDGAADPWGRYWIGSMAFDAAKGRGSLYTFHESTGLSTLVSGVTISNGIGWSLDHRTMYYVDSGPGTIFIFDVDDVGAIANQRVFTQMDVANEGTPDGLCVDAEGAIWVAVWGGYEVRRYAPSSELIGRVAVATAQPSCCAIGGTNATTLYITTAREDMSREVLEREPEAGRLFCVNVDVAGVSINPYRPQLRERVS
ncbi:MAG: SMP-30/gluconolactonase/LRE family protein [Acidimicrobiales bacterium]